MTDPTAALVALCRAVVPPTFDGRVPKAGDAVPQGEPGPPTGAHVIIYGGSRTPVDVRLDGQTHARQSDWSILAASNNPAGCRTVTRLLTDALDGARIDGRLLRVTYVSPPIEDRDDPSEWRWSSTVEITHETPR